jgi:CRP-like cAMP-binding protein
MDYVLGLLRSTDLLAGLTTDELQRVMEAGREVEFPAGALIVERDLLASDFYVILEGLATLEVLNKEPRAIGAGDYFGEISVLDGGPRTATVTAVTRVLAFRLERQEFIDLLDRFGPIGRKILVVMCGRLRYAESRMAPA